VFVVNPVPQRRQQPLVPFSGRSRSSVRAVYYGTPRSRIGHSFQNNTIDSESYQQQQQQQDNTMLRVDDDERNGWLQQEQRRERNLVLLVCYPNHRSRNDRFGCYTLLQVMWTIPIVCQMILYHHEFCTIFFLLEQDPEKILLPGGSCYGLLSFKL
jgi:hypothetical protein